MFKRFKSIEEGLRKVRLFAMVVTLGSLAISGWVVFEAMRAVDKANGRIYVLSNGKAMRAMAVDPQENLPVEARDHLRNFHHYFFDLSPDEKAIKVNLDRSFYLADGSAKVLYDNLLESGFINGLISGNITQSVVLDSIWLDTDHEPYAFRCTGLQTLIRPTRLTTRSIVTRGFLRRTGVERSDNNPHGFMIERFEVETNIEIKTISR
ncbi:conjugative transposon protein TraK [Puia dinghuensis]|uniref:Conjugative transposon protein TraK n=1 Tax=Puia dinghuensis TaxID=1792502 RepID=A0A8J2UHY7_9BACT|nr:conjugative transposon protein TraK [Puia dinghuensis]GGB20125.1 conjugative transposon protein TraK [Puia dinghuensis]